MNPRTLVAFLLGPGLCLSLAGPAVAAPTAGKKSETPAPTPAVPEAPIFDQEADGVKQLTDYQKVCFESGRRLLLVFGTDDCAPSRAFNRALHKDKFFEALVNQFVPVFIDVSGGTNASLLVHFNIDPHAEQPGIVILLPDGRVIEVLAHGEMAALARKGDAAVQEFFLARFLKTGN